MLDGCSIFPALCAYAAPIANNSRLILTSPNYPNNYEPNTRCHWTISSEDLYTERLRIQFLDFDLADSHQCEDDYVEIIDGRVCCMTYPVQKYRYRIIMKRCSYRIESTSRRATARTSFGMETC